MKIPMDKLSCVFSRALDIIEEEQIGATQRHGMRAAALCAVMGKHLGYDDDARAAVAMCALFHDNALTEYQLSKNELASNGPNMRLHCERGQSNVSWLPFKADIDGFILYHHENENGGGPVGKKAGEFPFEAALIAAADAVDVMHRLQLVQAEELPALRDKIAARADRYSTRAAIDILLEILDEDMLISLRDDNIDQTLCDVIPSWEVDSSEPSIIGIADFIARVIDYKSHFTRKHTSQIANRTWLMVNHYGYSREERGALYLAAALHDIGKIGIPTDVLEKPDRLNDEEFMIIKKHIQYTYDWLCDIEDFELIVGWASTHHEKLDGTGYPFGKKGDELDFNARLMACLDIYQAVSELRPYHGARSHEDTMQIMYDMAGKGFIDKQIVKDVDEVMKDWSMKDVPHPSGN